MKKLLTRFLALVILSGSALFAQDMTGSWQGTLMPPGAPKGLRIVIKVSRNDDKFKAAMYSIDQGAQPIPVGAFTVQGSSVKFTVAAINGTYEGKLGADAKSIAGTWTQGDNPLPLNLERSTAETAWSIPEPPPPVEPMKADAAPAFEVATIKPSVPGRPGRAFTMRGREVLTINTSVNDLIVFAYGFQQRQVTGGPGWTESERYDVTGTPDSKGRPNVNQFKMMVRKLLADRFQLTFHEEKKELSVYAIVVGKTGPKLTKSEDPSNTPGLMFPKLGMLPARNATMDEFAAVMQAAVLDRPVVDQTGITGRWDFTLTWTPDPSQFTSMGARVPAPPDDAKDPDLFTAFQQQLGLKLESTKAPVTVMVIDHVEKPSEN